MIPPSDYEDLLAYLRGRIDFERTLAPPLARREWKLERMRQLLDRLGNPLDGVPCLHIAGTKGKGSTAAMVSSILTKAGLRTGLYTSPHLDRVEERVRIDGRILDPADLCESIHEVQPAVAALDEVARREGDGAGPTFFEITTAMAFSTFRRKAVDMAVLEVGLGGRLDSTNVCRPTVTIITSVSFDHMSHLGNTLEAIAGEKAGIIKPGIPVISGVTAPEAQAVVARISRERGAPLYGLEKEIRFGYRTADDSSRDGEPAFVSVDFQGPRGPRVWRDLRLRLLGRHQAANASLALAAVEILNASGWKISDEAIRDGLVESHWPARIEVLGRRPTIVIDSAHNVASVEALLATLAESFRPRRRVLIFGTTVDKDIAGMMKLLIRAFDEIILTRYQLNPRGASIEALAELAETGGYERAYSCPDPNSALDLAQSMVQADDLICVTGSVFLAAEARRAITGALADGSSVESPPRRP